MEVLGIPPDHILHMASRTDKFFEKGAGGNWMLRRFRDSRKVGGGGNRRLVLAPRSRSLTWHLCLCV